MQAQGTFDASDYFKGKELRLINRRAARKAADLREINTSYGFWRACCLARCRRARTCTDDAEICFRDHSNTFSAEQRRWIDDMLAGHRRGLDWHEAAAQATRLMARRRSSILS